MANNVITLVIQAKNQASAVLKQVEKDAQAMQKNAAKQNPDPFLNYGSPATIATAGVAIAGSLAMVANQAAQTAAQYERLEHSTNSLGAQYGLTSGDIIAAVDRIAQGTLSNSTILEQANKAMLLGVADSTEEFETLTKIAIDRGRAMGISMEHAFNSIVLGVGRLSPLILDNLGIILDADTTYGKFAETIGKTADSLTDAEKRQALLGRLKAEMGNFDPTAVLDTASAWEQLAASIDNASIEFGEWLNNQGFLANALRETSKSMEIGSLRLFGSGEDDQVQLLTIELDAYKNKIKELEEATSNYNNNNPLTKFFTDISQNINLNALEEARKGLAETYEKLAAIDSGKKGTNGVIGKEFEEAARAATAIADAELKTAIEQERVNTLTREYQKLTGMSKAETENLVQSIIKISPNIGAAIAQLDRMVGGLQAAQAAASAVASAMGGAYSALESAAVEAYKNSGFSSDILGTYQQQLSTLQGVEKSLIAQGVSAEMLPFAVAQATDGATDYFDAINKAATATGSAGSATKQLTQEFSSLKGNVEGIFSNLFSDIGGVSVDDFLPREDAPNEAARRIADVMVKGFESPWAEYFKTSFPDLFNQYMGSAGGDVKIAAAQLLRDFQSGLRPELIDTNAVKEIAKRMFQADQSTSAMIDQVARELAAEMGISIEKATGYASGAAGRKVVDPSTLDEAKKALSLKPSFNFDGAKSDFVEAGKTSGFFTDSGSLLIETNVKVTSIEIPEDVKPKVDMTITSFVYAQTQDEMKTGIKNAVGSVGIDSYLDFSATDFTQVGVFLSAQIGSVSVATWLSSPEMTDIEAYKQNIMLIAGQIGLPITPTLSGDAMQKLVDISTLIRDNVTSTAQTDALAIALATNLGASFSTQAAQFSMQGMLLSSYIFQGVSQYQLGTQLAFEIGRQVGEAQASFEASGKFAGRKWGDAFLTVVGENVPFELLQVLTDLITPEVQRKLAEEESRK